MADARRLLAAGDTLAAMSGLLTGILGHALDPEPHALLADLLIVRAPGTVTPIMETLAARLLAPEDPLAWRRWAMVQARDSHVEGAYASLTRYFEMAGPAGAADVPALQLLEFLRQSQPGGELAQSDLRRRPMPRD